MLKSIASVFCATAAALIIAIPVLATPAVLVGRVTGSRVNVRAYPSMEADSIHYGLVGDRVEVIRLEEGEGGNSWYYVEFSSGARGWIRSDFVRFLANK